MTFGLIGYFLCLIGISLLKLCLMKLHTKAIGKLSRLLLISAAQKQFFGFCVNGVTLADWKAIGCNGGAHMV